MPENEKTRLQKFMGGGKQGYQIAFQMAWPAVMESFFIALAGMVDSLMVSSIGAYAVAAVGLTTQPKFIGLCIFIAMNVSVSALVARRRGEKDRIGANQVLHSRCRNFDQHSGGGFCGTDHPLLRCQRGHSGERGPVF